MKQCFLLDCPNTRKFLLQSQLSVLIEFERYFYRTWLAAGSRWASSSGRESPWMCPMPDHANAWPRRGATWLTPALVRCLSRRSCLLDTGWRMRWSRRFWTSVSWLMSCLESDGRFSSILIKNLASKMLVKAEIFIYLNSIVSSQILKIYCLKIHILYKFLRLFIMNTGHMPWGLVSLSSGQGRVRIWRSYHIPGL